MDLMPVGIAIISDNTLKYTNQSLKMHLRKISNNLNVETIIFSEIKFKLLSHLRQRNLSVDSSRYRIRNLKNRRASEFNHMPVLFSSNSNTLRLKNKISSDKKNNFTHLNN